MNDDKNIRDFVQGYLMGTSSYAEHHPEYYKYKNNKTSLS